MLFNDVHFLFLFLPLVLLFFWQLRSASWRLWCLLIASYIFYGTWNYKFLSLLLFSTCVDYWAGYKILKANRPGAKRTALIVSLVCNLGVLGFFKYYNFFVEECTHLLHALGMPFDPFTIQVVLPVGISFYTFQSLSYTIDAYRGIVKPTKSFLKFATYVALFPQLVAGPIVRYKDIEDQFDRVQNPFVIERFNFGLQLFLLGLFKKVLIADHAARLINPMFEQYQSLGCVESWLAVLGYAFQIYFDFSGYSDMAIGLGATIGFQFPINFNSPYKAKNMSDFWRRWHVTLSTWLRDYLYIPLGGSQSTLARTLVNVVIVFALGGLWHGAAWTFVVWGLYQGVFVAGYHALKKPWDAMPVWVQRPVTFVLVLIGWVFFRSDHLPMALDMLSKMFRVWNFELSAFSAHIELAVLNAVLLVVVNTLPNTNTFKGTKSLWLAIVFSLLLVWTIFNIQSNQVEFLYYQF